MKEYLKGVLVVEGKEDAAYLSNYISSEIVVINGFEMNHTTINYLKDKEVILLVDPDEAGKNIRKTLNGRLFNVINVEIDISKCNRGKKKGVAECDISEQWHFDYLNERLKIDDNSEEYHQEIRKGYLIYRKANRKQLLTSAVKHPGFFCEILKDFIKRKL